ncbi:MAG: FlgO family outer membrane protein [Acidobacteriota bacterium]|nr:FlgO family outer membrane protein [Acidobacteriota bacterium]
MAVEFSKSYVLDEFRIEPEKRLLLRDNKPVRLANRPFQVLLYLIENRDRIVTRAELLEKFWDGRDVYDEALTKCVGAIRKALNENPENPRFIETRWAEGYRFIGQVTEESNYSELSGFAIEKVSETKLVIEEIVETDSPVSEKIIPANAARQLSTQKRFPWKAGAVAVIGIVSITLGFLILLRLNANQNENLAPARFDSVAVLPLKNLSTKPESEIFSDGLTESLISELSKIENLKVISRNSVFAFKNKDTDPREIGKKLGAATVLEGTVRENGEMLRVEVRLVNTANGQILWNSDNFDRAPGDVFEIQDDIARNVATRLRLKLTSTDEERLAHRQTKNVEAYQAYVKGRYFWKKKDAENLEKARRFFEEAVRLDPNYALAYAGLVDYYNMGIWYAGFPPQQAAESAKRAASKAVELNPELPESYLNLAHIAAVEWDWEKNRKYLERSLELSPNEAQAWQSYAFYLLNVEGKKGEALEAIRRAQELDPLSRSINTDVGVMLTHLERYDEAITAFKEALETDPQFADTHWNLARTLERKGDYEQAFPAFLESARLNGFSEEYQKDLRAEFEKEGIRGYWLKSLEFAKKDTSVWKAAIYSRLGEKDLAIEHLERAFAAREPLMVNLKSEYFFDSLRSDPRFTDLLRRAGLNE